jgi:hypothetical protein
MRFTACWAIVVLAAVSAYADEPTTVAAAELGRKQYIENCGGCHGIEGTTSTARVPLLRDRVGLFLCSRQGRDYVGRLPSIALSRISDNAVLAELVNFVIFNLGGTSTPIGALPYTAEEIASLRKRPLTTASLNEIRRDVITQASASCLQGVHK